MGFYARSFLFDGIPSEDFGLYIYDMDNYRQSDRTMGPGLKIVEDRIPQRYDSLHYGITQNEPLTFNLVFGAEEPGMDRYDLERAAGWLTGHSQYKWLEILQPDLEDVRFRCMITELASIDVAAMPVAFSAKVLCDSPFAYTYPQIQRFTCSDQLTGVYCNRSSYRGYYYPKLKLTFLGGTAFSLVNNSDGGNAFRLDFSKTGIADFSGYEVTVDLQNQIITTNGSPSLPGDVYRYCNLNFIGFKQGENAISISGNCRAEFHSVFPVNVGN